MEARIEGVGSWGHWSLFLFQLDRIGTAAQREEKQQILSCDGRESLAKPAREREEL